MPRRKYRKRIHASEDAGFGYAPPRVPLLGDDVPPVPEMPQVSSKPPAALIALGPPPLDAAGIQKWNYQALTIMAWDVMQDETISQETRMKRSSALLTAASKHYPEAARFDLGQKIAADKAERDDRKARNKAGAKMEPRPSAGGAKVIPIRQGE